MKRNKGFVETALIVALLVYVGIVGSHIKSGEKAPETPAVTNYNK